MKLKSISIIYSWVMMIEIDFEILERDLVFYFNHTDIFRYINL